MKHQELHKSECLLNPQELPIVGLRAMEPEDLDFLYRVENDVRLWGVGSTSVPYSRYTLHDFIANSSGDIYTDRQVRLIVTNGEGTTIGLADLMNFDPRHNRAEVGLVIESPYRHRGYAQAALTHLHHYALHILHLHQLYVLVNASHEPVLKLFRKMGYEETATLPDWLYDGKVYSSAVLMQRMLKD